METVYYNFYSFEHAKASGGEDHRAILVRGGAPRRTTAGSKVISLEDYRARRAIPAAEEAAWELPEEPREPSGFSDSPRTAAPRTGLWSRLLTALELAACGALIAVAVAACAVFL